MDVKPFEHSPVGRLVPIDGIDARGRPYDHFAFVPDALPETFELSGRTWNTVSEAGIALGRLDGEGSRLPRPSNLVRPAIRAEAVSTSALEGTYTTLPRVMQFEMTGDEAPTEDREVLDYVAAAEYGFDAIQEGKPLSLNLIKSLHQRLMARDPHCPASEKGEIRRRQNFIGPATAPIEESYFVPPPSGPLLAEGLNDWEVWIHRQGDLPLLVRAAVGHYQFEALHPFVDGNGRIGRLIVLLLLLDEDALSVPLLNISPYLETRRQEYQERLREVSATGDFDQWVQFFVEGVRVQAVAGLQKTTELLRLKEQMIQTLRDRRVRGLAIQVAEDLIGNPILTPTFVRDHYGITYQSASNILQTLTKAGLLDETIWRKNRRLYYAPTIMQIYDR